MKKEVFAEHFFQSSPVKQLIQLMQSLIHQEQLPVGQQTFTAPNTLMYSEKTGRHLRLVALT